MSALKMLLGKHAPTHLAEKVTPQHDGLLNLVEARRGRGKSFGSVRITLAWLEERMPAILAGNAPHAKVYTNNRFNHRRLALELCLRGIVPSHALALKIVQERIIYITEWDQVLTAYDSLILMDEANRNLNIYDNDKQNQQLMLTVHDWLQQTRKHKLTLWFFVQDVEWVKNQLRSLMDRLWRAKRVRDKRRNIIKYFPWYGSDPFAKGKDGQLNRSADFKMRFDFELSVARIYDSWQAIATLEKNTRFRSFAEIEDYMLQHRMKPLPSPTIRDALTHEETQVFFASCPVPLALPPRHEGGGQGRGGAAVPPPVDLSSLPVSFPKDLL